MAKVVWSNNALSDLLDIAKFISKDSIKYAGLTAEKLYNKVSVLIEHPKLGRVVPELEQDNLRELIEGNYRIIYELEDDRVNILTVHHSSRILRL